MSTLLKLQKTPKNIRGVEIEHTQKIKFSAKKNRIFQMKIEIDEPDYDEDGQLIVPETNSDDELAPHLDGIFMAQLLDEDYQDGQEYFSPKQVLEGQDLQNDIKKHLNVDFDSHHSSQRSLSDFNSRRNSDQSLDNLANDLDNLQEPKSAAIYNYEPKDEENELDQFDI